MLSLLLALLPAAYAAQRGGKGFRDRPDLVVDYPELHDLDFSTNFASLHDTSNTTASNVTYRYKTNKTEPFLVSSLPEVNWDFGEMYSGLMPIDSNDTSRGLFFVFKPRDGDPVDDLTIWLNGGPGCSSLEGWFQENGPIIWQPSTYVPVANPYSWDKETNMIWVEQPVGTGFSIGTPTAQNEYDIAADFLKFFQNFQTTFGISNYKIYVTGESYAGRYVPYIASAMVDSNNTEFFNVSGALVYDPCIGDYENIQQEITAYPHVAKNNDLWGLNDTYLSQLEQLHKLCGFEAYIDQWLKFPPAGQQPALPKWNYTVNASCDVFDLALEGAFVINPCFNLYEIVDNCPAPFDPLATPAGIGVATPGTDVYFRRPDVIAAMHAPTSVNWTDCASVPVFPNGDNSPDSIQHVLPNVIEHTNRVLVSNADWDFVIITNGTLLAIQNMTWNGAMGFQSQPNDTLYVAQPDQVWAPLQGYVASDPQGTMGIKHYERGLMWVEAFQAGHMQPQYQPRAALLHIQWLLGRIDDLPTAPTDTSAATNTSAV